MSKLSPSIDSLASEVAASLTALGERVRAHRMRAGWTASEMSARLFCAPATYRAIEAGKPGTSVGILLNALWLLGQLESVEQLAPITPELASSFVKNRRMRRPAGAAATGRIAEDERDF